MSTAHSDTVRRLQHQKEAAQAALAAQQAKVRAAQAKLRHAAQQARLAHQQVMGRLAEEAGLATLDLETLRQAFAVLGQLAHHPYGLAQWVGQWRASSPEETTTVPGSDAPGCEAEHGTALPGSGEQSSLPSFPCGKR